MRVPPPSISTLLTTIVLGGVLIGPGRAEDVPRAEHPQPQARRDVWLNLNGPWQFRFDTEDRGLAGEWWTPAAEFDRTITVPFCWESRLSGIADLGGRKIGWYRRTAVVPESWRGKQVWLRFEAVDWEARVWVNGKEVARHEGGYSPFALDVTKLAEPGATITIVVRAFDATDTELPVGKQHGWYTPTSGIWQTVWLEARPARHVTDIRLTPRRRGEAWTVDVELDAAGADGRAKVEFVSPDGSFPKQQADVEFKDGHGRVRTELEAPSAKPWSPDNPHLYNLDVHLVGDDAATTDTLHTYFGLRTIELGLDEKTARQVILLNGEPIYLRGALDQSFNPEGVYTAPSDEFLRRDMEIARRLGLNFLRIHIKADEPRRLYWADRVGVMIMSDMPCTWAQSLRARAAWEETMRATILRDRNHPAIIAWCLFNETWGLGGNAYKTDKDTQAWVARMFDEVKEKLDPSRLVEDNSPCLYDHVKTDINSWHFYIDDYRQAREHIEDIVANTRPGSPKNYVPGRTQGTEPVINSEYGGVSAGGGDRDVSWCFRYLTTLLRQHNVIQGYVYTELSDIEWEHNGFVNYDRTSKEFGYDAFVRGMTVADLQGADFIGYDAPPAVEVAPGEKLSLPVFVSHYSPRREPPKLRWRIVGTNDLGQPVQTDPQEAPVAWEPYRVTFQKPLDVAVPAGRPFVGAVTLELLDAKGERIAANYVNLIVRPSATGAAGEASTASRSPRVEILGPRLVALRWDPDDFAATGSSTPRTNWTDRRGKFASPGDCEVRYDIALPEFVRRAAPTEVTLMAELATRADGRRLDWPSVRRDFDCPQTEERKYPGTVSVSLMDKPLWRFDLPDDPADSRGVLSHQRQFEHGSYGYLIEEKVDLTRDVAFREALRSAPEVSLVFRAVGKSEDDKSGGHGLTIYGETLGRYPIDPTLLIQTAQDVVPPVGLAPNQPVSVNRLLDRVRQIDAIPSGESGGREWRYTTAKPGENWIEPSMDDSSWSTGKSGFGTPGTPAVRINTNWSTPDIWLRAKVDLAASPMEIVLRYFHDEDAEIYVNGKPLLRLSGYAREYQQATLTKDQRSLFHEGSNTIAVHCHQTGGGQGIDVGVRCIALEGAK